MLTHAEVISRFYRAFQQRDAAGMNACYHPDVLFSDPVFPDLRGDRARAMWAMLCGRAKDLKIEFRDVTADADRGSAHWEAWYPFSGSGRQVHNVVEATFEFQDRLIVRHVDEFDLKRWAGQALGLPGRLLGGTRFMQDGIRRKAAASLDAWIAAKNR